MITTSKIFLRFLLIDFQTMKKKTVDSYTMNDLSRNSTLFNDRLLHDLTLFKL